MKKALRIIWLAVVLLFIYVPILVLAVYSFTDATMVGAGIGGFSFENYINLFKNDELREMIFGTVALAVVCACISTVLATFGAIGSFYSKKLTKSLVNTANQVPVVNADIVTGFDCNSAHRKRYFYSTRHRAHCFNRPFRLSFHFT